MQQQAKINRGHLVRAARKGELWLRCAGRYTDDYAYDAAVNFGKETEYRRVYLDEIGFDPEQTTWQAHKERIRELAGDCIIMTLHDFKTKSGYVMGDRFAVHSNLSYEFQIREQ